MMDVDPDNFIIKMREYEALGKHIERDTAGN